MLHCVHPELYVVGEKLKRLHWNVTRSALSVTSSDISLVPWVHVNTGLPIAEETQLFTADECGMLNQVPSFCAF